MSLSDRATRLLSGWSWLVLWGILVAVALAVRPLLPIDETRYLSVAWEMWRRGDWIVPYLNGSPYTDKPPLLFWGMLLGWRVFGVNEWWPRLLPPFFALVSALLLVRLARRLSPARTDVADRTLPFLSGALWVSYSTVVLFDTLLTACVLLALGGLVEAWLGRPRRGWLTYAAGAGLGLLAKGPVVFVYLLPVALLSPWWATDRRPASWRRWYLGLTGGVALAAGVGLAWALAAASREGPAYRAAILWHQTAGRMVDAFAHQRPWWWYLLLLPLILFPWTLWPPLWRSLARLRSGPAETSSRFALAWVVPGLIILSLISSKQVHYLIPLLPGFAMLASIAYGRTEGSPPGTGRRQVIALSLVTPTLVILAHLAGRGMVARAYDLRPVAHFLKAAEVRGRPIAHVGRYSGQFHFLGRLEHPFEQVSPAELGRWTADHPTGLVIRYERSPAATAGAIFSRPYRDRVVGIWEGTTIESVNSEQ